MEHESKKDERTMYIVLAIILMIAIGIIVTWYFTKDRYEDKDDKKAPKVVTKKKEIKKEKETKKVQTKTSTYVATTVSCTPEENVVAASAPVVVQTAVQSTSKEEDTKPVITLPENIQNEQDRKIAHGLNNINDYVATAKDVNGSDLQVSTTIKYAIENPFTEGEIIVNEDGSFMVEPNYTNVTITYVATNSKGETTTEEVVLTTKKSTGTVFTLVNGSMVDSATITEGYTYEYDVTLDEGIEFADLTKENFINIVSYKAQIAEDSFVIDAATKTITFKIVAEDETIFDVIKLNILTAEEELSNDASLASLEIADVTLNETFDPEVTSYTANVANDVENVAIEAKATDEKATVEVEEKVLEIGENTITITVTAEDGTTKTYTVVITRETVSNSDLDSIELIEE